MQKRAGRAPNPTIIAQQLMRRRVDPLGRPMMGWQTRFRYLLARLGSQYSAEAERRECRVELRRLRGTVATLHATLCRQEIDADRTGILADMDMAYKRLLGDIDEALAPAATAAE